MKSLSLIQKRIVITIGVIALSVITLSVPSLAEAQQRYVNTSLGDNLTSQEYFSRLYIWAVSLGILAASIAIIRAGYIYTASRGNPSAITSAKEIIINALVGLALLLLSYTILRFVLGPERVKQSEASSSSYVVMSDFSVDNGDE
jgi:hypothetical protein